MENFEDTMEFEELVRFYYKDTLVRITSTTGFERHDDDKNEWVVETDVESLFDRDENVGAALFTVIDAAAILDGVVKDMGKQVFLAAIRTAGMQSLGFRDATLN